MNDNQERLLELTSEIVSAHVATNAVATSDVPVLIASTFRALAALGEPPAPEVEAKPTPPAGVTIRNSVRPDYIVCLEDGKRFKSLKRHLRSQYNMSPEQYRDKWKLPADYPMVAPNYAVTRSQLAKNMGLGQQRRRRK